MTRWWHDRYREAAEHGWPSRIPRSPSDLLRRPRIRPVAWTPPPNRERVEALVVIPCGPGNPDGTADTVASVLRHVPRSRRVVLTDDATADGTAEALAAVVDDTCTILRNETPSGLHMLHRSLGRAYRWSIDNCDFDLLLRIDTDALVLGPGVFEAAREHHRRHPSHGCFGRFDTEPDGSPRSFAGHVAHLARHERRVGRTFYDPLLRAARANGWVEGANVFGAACLFTHECVVAMCRIGAFDIPDHSRYQHITEDLYFSIAVAAAGFELGHFAAPDGPLALAWRDLPFEPEEILRRGDLIVHSVDKGPRGAGSRAVFGQA